MRHLFVLPFILVLLSSHCQKSEDICLKAYDFIIKNKGYNSYCINRNIKTDVGVQLNFELLNQKENLEFEKIADFNASIIENSELIDQLPDQFVSKYSCERDSLPSISFTNCGYIENYIGFYMQLDDSNYTYGEVIVLKYLEEKKEFHLVYSQNTVKS